VYTLWLIVWDYEIDLPSGAMEQEITIILWNPKVHCRGKKSLQVVPILNGMIILKHVPNRGTELEVVKVAQDTVQWRKFVNIVSCDRVTIDGVWIGSRIYRTLKQLATALYKSLTHTD
jgi:hypothetical protein